MYKVRGIKCNPTWIYSYSSFWVWFGYSLTSKGMLWNADHGK